MSSDLTRTVVCPRSRCWPLLALINMANPDYLEEYEDKLRETKGSEYWSWSAPTTVTP